MEIDLLLVESLVKLMNELTLVTSSLSDSNLPTIHLSFCNNTDLYLESSLTLICHLSLATLLHRFENFK